MPLPPWRSGSHAGPEVPLTEGQVVDGRPHFSLDGKRICFTSDRLGKQEVWILDIASRKQERLHLPGEDLGVVGNHWFPDGRQLMLPRLHRVSAGPTYSTRRAAIDGSRSEEVLPQSPARGELFLGRDGGNLACLEGDEKGNRIFLMDLATRKPRQTTSSPGNEADPVLAPDGRFLAFTSDATGSRQAYRIPISGGEPQVLTSGSDRMRHLSFSPDGRWLDIQPSHRNIRRLPATGGALQPVTRFPESDLFLEEPSLSPDGRTLAYRRNHSTASLWLLTLESRPSNSPRIQSSERLPRRRALRKLLARTPIKSGLQELPRTERLKRRRDASPEPGVELEAPRQGPPWFRRAGRSRRGSAGT